MVSLNEQYGNVAISSDYEACAVLVGHGGDDTTYGGILHRWFNVVRLIDEEKRELEAEGALAQDPTLHFVDIEHLRAQVSDIQQNWMSDSALLRIERMLRHFQWVSVEDRRERRASFKGWTSENPELSAAFLARHPSKATPDA